MLATLLLPLVLLAPPQDRPSATELVDQAKLYLPDYSGEHRAFLTPAQKSGVQAASHLFSAALALEPQNALALRYKGHAQVLLGEDQLNREQRVASRASFSTALECFDQAVAQQPEFLWTWYARAMAHQRLGSYARAIDDFEHCISLAQATIAEGAYEDAITQARALKFKARLWRSDCRMQLFEFETARSEYRAFYADNGNDAWDLGIKIAETYLRERDFSGAIQTYEALLEVPRYADFHGAYTFLGYLEGLHENHDKAYERLNQALARERKPTLYPRLWHWILAPTEHRAETLDLLKRFVANPPGDLSPWDLTLGRFMTGAMTAEAFLTAAKAEVERRKLEAIPLDDLMCEVWFYAGWHHEQQGSPELAIAAYRKALASRPAAFKWEWAYARLRFARLMRAADPKSKPSEDPGPPRTILAPYTLSDPGLAEGEDTLGLLERSRPAGDLLLYFVWNGGPDGRTPRLKIIGL